MEKTGTNRSRATTNVLFLICLIPVSLFLTVIANRAGGQWLHATFPSASWIADAAMPSFLVIAGLYALFGEKRALLWPKLSAADRHRVARLSILWLLSWFAGCVISAVIMGHWLVYARGLPMIAAFLLFGPLGEELLFRGLVFEKARSVFPSSSMIAIAISTLAFSLHHLFLHTAPRGLAVAQILFTIPMGAVFATIRERTGSVWPALFLHVATNLPAVI